MRDPGNRKVSFGTRVMLVVTLLVLIGSVMVLIRFSSGRSIHLSGAGMVPLNLEENYTGPDEVTVQPGKTPETDRTSPDIPQENTSAVSAAIIATAGISAQTAAASQE